MLTNWINRIKRFFNDEDSPRREQLHVQERSVSFLPKKIEGRVQHIYPKAGTYRFPIDIQPKTEHASIQRVQRQQHRRDMKDMKDMKETSKQKSYFQGTLQKSRLTPSPIHGYQKIDRQKEQVLQEIAVAEQATEEIAVTEQATKEIVRKDQVPKEIERVNQEVVKEIEPEDKVSKDGKEIPSVAKQIGFLESKEKYQYPQLSTLQFGDESHLEEGDAWINEQAATLMETFEHFNLKAVLIGVTQGPAVTRFEVQPAPGMKISKFTNLQDDLKLSLAAKEIRIEAPIPGKHAIGIEVPNLKPRPVRLGDILASDLFQNSASPLTICLGSGLDGEPVVTDIQKMPHGLIAGSTGSGKSVCINSILVSLLYKSSPEQLRLLLIDPKVVELTPYQSIPHLVTPVVTDPKRATAALKWAVEEMERRYQYFANEGVRDLARYNKVLEEKTGVEITLPYIVIIIDELADLMMVSAQDVEDSICRITQKARACGIHLIVATQRPSVDVITGLIKANIPTRLAFSVSSQVDSRTILDMVGAERLLGKGDMLFLQNGAPKPIRVQGNFVSDEEIEEIIQQVSASDTQHFLFSQEDLLTSTQDTEVDDEFLEEAAFFVMEQGVASASSLQRKFRIGYNRAARMIDWMEEQGIISESLGSKPRTVLWSQDQFLNWLDQHNQA
jgi:S-DNA-T family DNA segregation ATPase FtsK/SpoIIIE